MVTVDLSDELLVTRLEPDRLSRYAILWHPEAKRQTEIDWSITTDLAVRAHLALEAHVERRLPVQLKLEKRIPVGGGLGGGSSDAATMLLALNELFELGLSSAELAEIGGRLGSDVPYLIARGSAMVEGVGEQIRRLGDAPLFDVVIIMPPIACSTAAVYQAYDRLPARDLRPDAVRALASAAPGLPAPETLFNDLLEPALAIAPELKPLMAEIARLVECPVHLTGSGSCLFVLAEDPLHAEAHGRVDRT